MKILHLEDNPRDAELVTLTLIAEFPGCTITTVVRRDDFLAGLAESPDLVLSDFSLPGFSGLEALALVRELQPQIPFVFLSGTIGEERAIAAVLAGAYDYVLKDNMARLPVVLRHVLDDSAQRRVREKDERRLRELADIIERSTEAIVVSDMSMRITLWNEGAARLYGVPAAEAVGRTSEEVFPAGELLPLRTAREATLETGDWRHELSVTTRDGRNIVVDLHMTLVRDAAGQPTARLTIATDITEKKKLEEQFLRAQRVESLGLLAAGIAHDFNNILAPMVMAMPLLRQRATHPGDIRMLEILEKNTERGAGLVRQILGFARGASGTLQLTQVKHLLRDVAEVIEASFPKSIVLDEQVPTNLWPIHVNPTQIHQVLLNLAVNARDAMLPRGGTLRLRAENQQLGESAVRDGAQPGCFLVLEVADTGTGMSSEILAHIWEPFFTTKGEGKGTGLGLSTVRGIAAAHRGFVTVESRIGHGTTFRVFLPASQADEQDKCVSTAAAIPRGRGQLILVVDDEANVRDVAEAILIHHGYRVLACKDGVEAIGLFTEHSAAIQMVITDINMPNLDGAALARVLLRLKPDLRILGMTGLGSSGAPGTLETVSFSAKLPKPFNADALLGAVHRLLNNAPAAASAPSSPEPGSMDGEL
ncbi:MAG: hybrid sensor histidine kinase/response regulator [Verrucomicrobia bacterium]|nr:hybrid sensor histidine kinase/response regulator [Verrucomicrobiota bacterium]